MGGPRGIGGAIPLGASDWGPYTPLKRPSCPSQGPPKMKKGGLLVGVVGPSKHPGLFDCGIQKHSDSRRLGERLRRRNDGKGEGTGQHRGYSLGRKRIA